MSMRILVMLLTAGLVVLIGAGVLLWLVPAGARVGGGPNAPAAEAPIPEAVTPADLDKLIAGHHGPVLLDFHADYCEPCRELHPRLGQLAAAHQDLLVIGVDAVKAEAIAQTYKVGDLPVIVLLTGGAECARHVGAPDLATLHTWYLLHLAAQTASATAADAATTAAASATSAEAAAIPAAAAASAPAVSATTASP